jgi:hypothetical protein
MFSKPIFTRKSRGMHLFYYPVIAIYYSCLAKRSRALLASNPTRDTQTRAGECPAGPGGFHCHGLFFPYISSFICPVMPKKRTSTLLTYPILTHKFC